MNLRQPFSLQKRRVPVKKRIKIILAACITAAFCAGCTDTGHKSTDTENNVQETENQEEEEKTSTEEETGIEEEFEEGEFE